MKYPTLYRTIPIDGLSIFYREAGPKDAPTLLLLHGLPSSSRMFEPLFARLSDRYHLVAPDYPGFGHSDWPDPKKFAYTFDHIAGITNHFAEALGLSHYTLYMQDYGGPVGFRMALAHPDRIESLIVQDAVAHNEGLGANWKTRRAFWADRAANESALRTNLLSLPTIEPGPRSDDEPTIDGIDEVQLGLFTARIGNLFPVCRGGPLWHLGILWTAQCVLGRLRPVRGLHSQAQLVFARGNDPDASDDRHRC